LAKSATRSGEHTHRGEAVHLVPEGTPGAMIVSVKRVNELDFYSLGLKDLADKIEISQPRTLALVKHLNLQGSRVLQGGPNWRSLPLLRNRCGFMPGSRLDAR
jgi:hypothetical protein